MMNSAIVSTDTISCPLLLEAMPDEIQKQLVGITASNARTLAVLIFWSPPVQTCYWLKCILNSGCRTLQGFIQGGPGIPPRNFEIEY